jgi:hypothetical protein
MYSTVILSASKDLITPAVRLIRELSLALTMARFVT